MKDLIKSPRWILPLLVFSYFAISVSLLPPVLLFQDVADVIIVDSLQRNSAQSNPSLFMERIVPFWSKDYLTFYSQFGLTYRVLLPIRQTLPYPVLPMLLSIVYALTTAAIFLRFQACFAANTGTRLASFSDPLLRFSRAFDVLG